jgi:type I restriction enzyme, S subunit
VKLETKRLKRLFASATGGSWGTDPGGGEVDMLCIRGTDFDTTRFRVDSTRAPIRAFTRREIETRAAASGDLILEKSGGGEQQPVGRAVLWDGANRVMPTNFAARLRVSTDTDPRFATYLLASMWSDGRTGAAINQTTGIQNLDLYALLDQRIPCSPLDVQQNIADYLDRETRQIDRAIIIKRLMVKLLEERRTVLLRNFVLPSSVPPTWNQTRLKYLFESVQTGAWGANPEGGDDDVLCIRVADFDRKRFIVDGDATTVRLVSPGERTQRSLQSGDVLIEKSGGGDGQPVGFAVGFELPTDAICSNFVARLRPAAGVNSKFASLVMAAAYRSGFNIPYIKQTTGIQNLDLSAYLAIPWTIPPYAEQSSIVDRLSIAFRQLDALSNTLIKQVDLLQERRQMLITAAVTRQFNIPEAV